MTSIDSLFNQRPIRRRFTIQPPPLALLLLRSTPSPSPFKSDLCGQSLIHSSLSPSPSRGQSQRHLTADIDATKLIVSRTVSGGQSDRRPVSVCLTEAPVVAGARSPLAPGAP